jgi:hypothetical protein
VQPVTTTRARCAGFVVASTCLLAVAAAAPADAAGCSFEPQGEGRVAAVIDARTFRLTDGREIRLAGIEPVAGTQASRTAALSAVIAGREVSLSGDDDGPDRYGRQPAFVFLAGNDAPVQSMLLALAEALRARRGTWADPAAIKNAESPGDILAGIGRFTVVEGRVLSVRQAGATTYLNFGRNWTRDFAVTISRRAAAAHAAAGISLKSLENRRVRVRGWVEARGGPRIELLHVGQIEMLGGN